jgi:hypothetical protein
MNLRGRLMVFSVVASVLYTLSYYFDWSLFQYYVAEGRFHFSLPSQSAGPPILWYGWLATASLGGIAAAIAVPRRLMTRLLLPDLAWLIPVATLIAAVMYELRWFV